TPSRAARRRRGSRGRKPLREVAEIGDLHGGRAAVLHPPRPHGRAAYFQVLPATGDVPDHDHRAGDHADVLGVQDQLLPDALDVAEVLAQPVVAEIRTAAAGEPCRAGEVELAVRADVAERRLDVTPGERVVDRTDDVCL